MKRIYGLVCLILAGLLALTACGNGAKGSETSSADMTQVTIQLAWTHEYFAAGFYAANESGHFSDRNLEVTLVEGGFGENGYIEPIEVVVNGTYDFGISDAEALIRARAEGKPVVAIATIMQRSPNAIISLAEAGIVRPQDLPNHTVQVADGGARGLYNALLNSQDVAAENINTQSRVEYGIAPLLNGDTDALMGWIINEGVQVKEAGETPNFILLSDYGIDTYSLVVFTTEATIEKRPEVVKAFLGATLEGYQDAIANPTRAAEYVIKYNNSLDYNGQLHRLEAMIPLINIPGQDLGVMNEQVWANTQAIMIEAGSLDAPIDLQSVYTTTFLDNIYSN